MSPIRASEGVLADEGPAIDAQGYARAVLNILADAAEEKARLTPTLRAMLNVLEDAATERTRLEATQRAVLNILEDSADEKARLAETQRAMLNLLDDFDTEKKRVEAINVEREHEIEQRVRAERELSERAEELARSNRDLEQFAYVASHDLQEPLRMVASYTQLLERRYRGRLDADAHEFIAYAVEGATRMQTLVNDLLAYSRLGRRNWSTGPVDCQAILARALGNLRAAIEESQAVVTSDPLPTLAASETELAQLLQNLISNALKFRADRPPAVHVSATRAGAEWVFSVRDNGIGIAPEHMDRIFVIFQRLHSRARYAGTGIGLAICKKIVERHGGRIWVESEPARGSTFFFTIREQEQAA